MAFKYLYGLNVIHELSHISGFVWRRGQEVFSLLIMLRYEWELNTN